MALPAKKFRQAFDDGAHAKRGGMTLERTLDIWDKDELAIRCWAADGWRLQQQQPKVSMNYMFYLKQNEQKMNTLPTKQKKLKGNIMPKRNAKELEALKTEYQTVYDPYAAAEREAGREPQAFDEAFDAHLTALDAEADDGGDVAIQTVEALKADKGTKGKGKTKADPKPKAEPKPKKVKEPKAPKPKAFRPTADDRKALNAAAQDAATKAKAEGTPRLKPQDAGQTYSDFLSGKVLKLDEKGNGTVSLNVVTAKAMDVVVGRVDVTVKGGVMSAKGVKA